MKQDIKTITIIGTKRFQNSYVNAQFSSEIIINGELVHKINRQYGYGDQYKWISWNWIIETYNLNIKKFKGGWVESVSSWCERNNVTYNCHENIIPG